MLDTACPKPTREEKAPRKGINRASQKAKASGELLPNSTFKRKSADPSKANRKPSSRSSGTKTGMMRRKSVKPRNAKRRASEFARCYGSKERVAFVKALPCAVVSCMGTRPLHEGPIENAHVETGGMGRKADARLIVPLCREHHRALHNIGVEGFESVYRIDLHREAERTEAEWARSQGGDSR